jgi:two-component system nitrogen regulation response regulator NtrX
LIWIWILERLERILKKKYILAQIKKFNGNISKTANFIGMDRTALHRKMKDLNIMPNERYRNIIGY